MITRWHVRLHAVASLPGLLCLAKWLRPLRQQRVTQFLLTITKVQLAIKIALHAHSSFGGQRFAWRLQLIELILKPHYPISTQCSFLLETEDAGQVIPLSRAVIVNRRTWRHGKLLVQLRAKATSQKLIGRGGRVAAGEAQFFHQTILVNAVVAFHSPF